MSELKNITLSKRDLYSPVAQLVLGDRKTSGIRFNINRFDGGVDLSGIGWSVKILAADGSSDVQTLTAEVTDMWVLLDWVFPAIAASSVGETTIEVEGVGGNGTKVWQSGKRIIRVIDDLDAEPGYEEEDVTLLQQAIETATVKVEALDSSVNDMVSDLYDLSDSLDALEDRVDTAEASVESTATQAQTTINNLVSGAQTTFGNLYNHTQARYNELNGQVEELSDTIDDLSADVTGLQGSVATAVGNANTATANANAAASSANAAASSATSAASSANTAAGNATSIYNTVRTAYESGDLNGTNGDDGVSPTVAVTETSSGHRVTITDATGNHQFDVSNGQNGQDVTSLEVVSSETITVPSMAEHNALSSTVSGHTGNGNIHVTASDKSRWDGKADASTVSAHTGNSAIHVTANEKSAWTAKADASTVTAHTGNSTIHVTADDKAKWDGIDSISGELTEIYTALDGKQDTLVAGSNVSIAADGKTISVPDVTALKADFDQVVTLLGQVKTALEDNDIDTAISLLDTFLLDQGVLE